MPHVINMRACLHVNPHSGWYLLSGTVLVVSSQREEEADMIKILQSHFDIVYTRSNDEETSHEG